MEKKTILAIGAHMDDCEIGAGGLIAKAVKKGHRVVLVNVASDYSTWRTTQGREEEIKERVLSFAARIGVEKRFIGYGYQQVPRNLEAIRKLAEVVLDVQPDLTVFHNRFEPAPSDHATVGYIAERAVRDATRLLNRYVPFSQEMYAFEVYPRISEFQPDMFIDITDVIAEVAQWPNYFDEIYAGALDRRTQSSVSEANRKPKASVNEVNRKGEGSPRAQIWLDFHGEREIPLWTHGDMKLVTAGFRGWQCGVRYAEAYMSLDKRVIDRRLLQEIVA